MGYLVPALALSDFGLQGPDLGLGLLQLSYTLAGSRLILGQLAMLLVYEPLQQGQGETETDRQRCYLSACVPLFIIKRIIRPNCNFFPQVYSNDGGSTVGTLRFHVRLHNARVPAMVM